MNYTENFIMSDERGENEFNISTEDENLFTTTENLIFSENGLITNSNQLFFNLPEMLRDLIYTEKCSKCDEFKESAIRFKSALSSSMTLSAQFQSENLYLKGKIRELEHKLIKQKEKYKAFGTCTEIFNNCKIVDCPFCLPFPSGGGRSKVTAARPTPMPPLSNLQSVTISEPSDNIGQSSLPKSSSSVPSTNKSSSVPSSNKSSSPVPSTNLLSSTTKLVANSSLSLEITKKPTTTVPVSSSTSILQTVPLKLQCFHGIKSIKAKLCLCGARFPTRMQLYVHLKLTISVESNGIAHNLVCGFCGNKKFRSWGGWIQDSYG